MDITDLIAAQQPPGGAVGASTHDVIDWSLGHGRQIRGPARDLALYLCGRQLIPTPN